MAKQLALTDFRAVRRVLEPEDFALGAEQPDPPPSDSISEESWTGIMSLPDDVAIRTSDHNGKALGQVYWLWGKWIEAIGETSEVPMFDPMLDAGDDLQSSMFNALHGYYRAAFAGLRNVLEAVTIGTCGTLAGSPQYANYRAGSTEFSFGNACDQLANEPNRAVQRNDAGGWVPVIVGPKRRYSARGILPAAVSRSLQLRAYQAGFR